MELTCLAVVFVEPEVGNTKTVVYEKLAPQLLQRLSLMTRQHRMPMGKKKMARKIPQQVKSSCMTPTLQDGHPPMVITGVAMMTLVCIGGGANWG